MKKGISHCGFLLRIKFLVLNVPFQFVLGQEVINTIKKVNRKVWSGTKLCYCILHERLLLGNNQFSTIHKLANNIKTHVLLYFLFQLVLF